jgi:hypothetical protein
MLAQTQKQLEGHFQGLSRERAGLGYPVYAFEHGLDLEAIDALRKALCAELVRIGYPKPDHWLLWTIVAAEVGYTYDGDEYWDSFETEIPRWVSYGSRETVRGWFRDFTKRFNGIQPTGRWAEHFSIIAWPITHSILPQYLQSQFARHLYDLRHELAANDDASADELGNVLGERYYGNSSRFENFLQQTALTARLVLALRDEDVQGSVTPIYRPTLARIVEDLERKGASRGYLRDARHVLRNARLRVRAGLAGPAQRDPQQSSNVVLTIPPGIKLVGRRTADDSWTLAAALPDFPALMKQIDIALPALDKARIRFSDKPEIWMPGRALLSYSDSHHALQVLPNPLSDSIIQFQEPAGPVAALAPQLTILSRPPWLLRVDADGIARQMLGNHIRTGEDYLIATTTAIAPDIASAISLNEASSRTGGAFLYRMLTPRSISYSYIQALTKLGLGYALQVKVAPIGLVPRWDEAKACSVWLPNEEILLRLSADFPVAEFIITIDGVAKTRLSAPEGTIISLGHLGLGRHTVEIAATAAKSSADDKAIRSISPETIFIEVRAPVPWRNNVKAQTGLRLILEPADTSLDDLLEKRASLSLQGPAGRSAAVEARLYDTSGHITETSDIGRLDLPSNDTALARIIERLAKEPLSEKIQSAPRVELAFVVDELGAIGHVFPHPIPPLRWKLTREGPTHKIRLVDEAGAAPNISVSRYPLAAPDRRESESVEACLQGLEVKPPGSLFSATHDGRFYAAFASVPPAGKLSTFLDLSAQIALAVPGDSAAGIMRLLAILRIWRRARPLGALAVIRKARVLETIEKQVERLACGARWSDKAQRYRQGEGRLENLQGEVGGSPGFASRMRTTHWTWHSDNIRARSEFYRLAKTYGVSSDKGISDLALQLAFHPASVRLNDPKKGKADFEMLGRQGQLARGAYFAKLTSDLRFIEASKADSMPKKEIAAC